MQRASGKPQGDGRKREREWKSNAVPACEDRDGEAGDRGGKRRPPCRLVIGGEVTDNAKPIGDWQPEQQPAGRDLGQGPLRQQAPQLFGRDA